MTHADGTVSKRGSKTRAYSHAVEVAPAAATDYAAYLAARAKAAEAEAATLWAAADKGSVSVRSRGFSTRDDLVSHQATLLGTGGRVDTWCSADGRTKDFSADFTVQDRPVVAVTEYLIRWARQAAEAEQAQAARYAAEAADVLAAGTPVGAYGVVRWSSSAALATKALAEFEYLTARGHQIRVVPVD